MIRVALLYDANSALVDTAGITTGLADLLTGRPAGEVRSTRLVVAALGGFALAVLVLRTVQLSRLSAWQRRRGRRSPWSALPGIGTCADRARQQPLVRPGTASSEGEQLGRGACRVRPAAQPGAA